MNSRSRAILQCAVRKWRNAREYAIRRRKKCSNMFVSLLKMLKQLMGDRAHAASKRYAIGNIPSHAVQYYAMPRAQRPEWAVMEVMTMARTCRLPFCFVRRQRRLQAKNSHLGRCRQLGQMHLGRPGPYSLTNLRLDRWPTKSVVTLSIDGRCMAVVEGAVVVLLESDSTRASRCGGCQVDVLVLHHRQ